jgi:hypothetical protein
MGSGQEVNRVAVTDVIPDNFHPTIVLTDDLIMQGATHPIIGGWNEAQLRHLGTTSYENPGWRRRLVGKVVTVVAYQMFLSLRGCCKPKARTAKARRRLEQIDELARSQQRDLDDEGRRSFRYLDTRLPGVRRKLANSKICFTCGLAPREIGSSLCHECNQRRNRLEGASR